MRVLRGLGGAVVWLLACIMGLVGCILCVTILLIPLGLLVLRLSKDLFALAMRLMLPRAVAHPVEELERRTRGRRRVTRPVNHAAGDAATKGRKTARRARKKLAAGH